MLSLFRVTLYTLACLIFTRSAFGQVCTSATNCTECIQLAPNCVWCSQANYSQPRQRCIDRTSMEADDCTMTEDPSGDSATQVEADFGGGDFTQVSPQRFSLNLRPGQTQTVQVGVRPANNFPVDIYYLMDQSFSMNDDLENLRSLASTLASTISSITTNFQLGFGSFVDKELVPYISVETLRLNDPCREDGVPCEQTYSARHSLSLTSNADQFSDLIQREIISGNLDSPEGGFDALLQIIVCQDIVGWRQNARHIIVYLTDAGFHFAGDGKLGGVVTPNDGGCYLERSGATYRYTRSRQQDYPSVGQINSLLQRFDIIPIFAAQAGARSFYDNLRTVITNAFVGTLAVDSSNIVDLINDTYNTISQTVRLDPDRVNGITVDVTANCPSGSSMGETCTGVLINQTANFIVNVTSSAQFCAEFPDGRDLVVRIPGFGQFVMELNGVCGCNCTDNPEINSTFCNNRNGSLVCGQCDCNMGWVGDTCECATSNISTTSCPTGANNITCTSPERGICVCGTCQCNQVQRGRYFGPACECNDFSCDVDSGGLVCGGPDQGMCGCDQMCTCQPDWTGTVCDCTLSTRPCTSPLGQVCSNRGHCMCGECICNGSQFSGPFCEVCTGNDCPENPECLEFQNCSICQTFPIPDGLNCSAINCTTQITSVEGVDTATYQIDGTSRTTFCRVTQGECAYQYFVGTRGTSSTGQDFVVEFMEADCGQEEDGVEPWIIIVAILGGLILLAILILVIIRIFIELRYCVEFRQWKKELERARFAKNDNPLFQKATEDFVNPAYGK